MVSAVTKSYPVIVGAADAATGVDARVDADAIRR